MNPIAELVAQAIVTSDLADDLPASRVRALAAYIEQELRAAIPLTPQGTAWAGDLYVDGLGRVAARAGRERDS